MIAVPLLLPCYLQALAHPWVTGVAFVQPSFPLLPPPPVLQQQGSDRQGNASQGGGKAGLGSVAPMMASGTSRGSSQGDDMDVGGGSEQRVEVFKLTSTGDQVGTCGQGAAVQHQPTRSDTSSSTSSSSSGGSSASLIEPDQQYSYTVTWGHTLAYHKPRCADPRPYHLIDSQPAVVTRLHSFIRGHERPSAY